MTDEQITNVAAVLERIDALKRELEKHGAKVAVSISVKLPRGKYKLHVGQEKRGTRGVINK